MPDTNPDAVKSMTKADMFALSKLPDGWFEWHDVPAAVRCPEFRLLRLIERGKVERKLEGQYPNSNWLYRVKETKP